MSDTLSPCAFSVLENETVFEGMTSVSSLIETVSDGTNDRKIRVVLFDQSRLSKKGREFRFLKFKSEELGFQLRLSSADELNMLTSGTTHGGVLAIATTRTYPVLSLTDLEDRAFWVLLDGIEDPYNFGYSVRSLYASGADGIVLPPRNWMSSAGVVARSSAGTSEKMKIRVANPADAIDLFHQAGYRILAAEIRDSESLYDADLSKPLLFVVGGEKRGISRELLSKCDANVRIEYGRDFKGSLSAAATSAILGFEVFRRNKA